MLKNDWDWMKFQIRMLKYKISTYDTVNSIKDMQIEGLKKVIESYKDYSKEIKPKFWQSPFWDVLFFISGFITAVYLSRLL